MNWLEFLKKIQEADLDMTSKVYVSYPCALTDGRDSGVVDSVEVDGDGDLIIWADV